MIINEAILKFKKEDNPNILNPNASTISFSYLQPNLKQKGLNSYILVRLAKVEESSKYLFKAEYVLFFEGKISKYAFELNKFKNLSLDTYELKKDDIKDEDVKKYIDKKVQLIVGLDIAGRVNTKNKELIRLNFKDLAVVEDCSIFCNNKNYLILINQNIENYLTFSELKALDDESKRLKKLNDVVKEEYKDLIKQMDNDKEALLELKKIIDSCKEQEKEFSNLFIKKSEDIILDWDILNANLQESIEHIKNYILCKHKHSFNDDLILNMLLGVYSNQIVILAGAPGSGKTSFVKYFADAVGKYEIVSVQANWMDRSDLLGYYNPIDKSFQASVFLEKLVKLIDTAKLHKDVFYFIILDEMNLSTVEYYFADFLSAWNAQIDEEIKIELYSKSILDEDGDGIDKIIKRTGEKYGVRETDISKIVNELEKILNENNAADKKELSDIIIKCKKIKKYPWELVIPKNLKFIATINKDATTKDLSPKVIDRSYFIRMEMSDKLDNNKKAEKVDKKYLKYSVDEKELQGLAHEEYLKILDIKKRANEYKLRINNRFDVAVKNIINYLDNDESNQEIINSAKLKNFLIAALVLPKISMKKSQIEDFLENILQNDENRFLENIINNMKSNDDDEVTYWRE